VLARFSREAFEASANPDQLSAELEAVLRPRLRAASDRMAEAHGIIEDLRQAGHSLWSWDESTDFVIWGDDYVNPPSRTRFLIAMRWSSGEDASEPDEVDVEVTFGPWPAKGN
jgi:hypothetical protein